MLLNNAKLWIVTALLSIPTAGCAGLLGIDDRSLDTEELNADGYEGCEPENGACDSCTTEWHQCICDGWGETPEPELRLECADKAPASIRDDVEEEAQEAYDEYLAQQADDAGQSENEDPTSSSESEPEPGTSETPTAEPESPPEPESVAEPEPVVTGTGVMPEPENVAEPEMVGEPEVVVEPSMNPEPDPLLTFNDLLCDFEVPPDACIGCFCGECSSQIQQCLGDRGCSEVMDCAMTLGCDTSLAVGPGSCYTAPTCRSVVDDWGGPEGESYLLFLDTAGCRQNHGCPCDGQMQGPPGCSAGDCSQCRNCWDSCVCGGGTLTQCQQMCGTPECQPGDGCALCSDCVDGCLCGGGSSVLACLGECNPGGPECTPNTNCNCNDCRSACLCAGGTEDACNLECAIAGGDCAQFNACGGCLTCEGSCGCNDFGTPQECLLSCGSPLGCLGDGCDTCGSCQSQCECETRDPHGCLLNCQALDCSEPFPTVCEACSCSNCPSQYSLCREIPGCLEFMSCMLDKQCSAVAACMTPETCGAQVEGLAGPEALGVLEALQRCRQDSGCECQGGPAIVQDTVTCSNGVVCNAYYPQGSPGASACCGGVNGEVCGIDPLPIFGTVPFTCVEWGQPGEANGQCPRVNPPQAPYNGTSLQGCCRPEGVCGFLDEVTGLGCIESKLFGVDQSTTCTLPQ